MSAAAQRPSAADGRSLSEHGHADGPGERSFSGFAGHTRIASGALPEMAVAAARALAATCGPQGPPAVLVFDDSTGRPIDLDLRGTETDVRKRAGAHAASLARGASSRGPDAADAITPAGKRPRGRPRLGVVGKEVTLLPRHWAWLDAQPGGASATLRRLVDDARRKGDPRAKVRNARDAAYRFMSAIGGDLPGYEEALRALFGGRTAAFRKQLEEWPPDVRDHAVSLATDAFDHLSDPNTPDERD